MRIKQGLVSFVLSFCMFSALGLFVHSDEAVSQDLSVNNGSISIRALADRQRRLEEAEFLNSLNPSTAVQPSGAPMIFQPSDDNSVQVLPPVGQENRPFVPVPIPVEEPKYEPANTVLSVYGPEGNLVVEVAGKKGEVNRYRVGNSWAGHQIVAISRDGVTVSKGNKNRTIAVGGRL